MAAVVDLVTVVAAVASEIAGSLPSRIHTRGCYRYDNSPFFLSAWADRMRGGVRDDSDENTVRPCASGRVGGYKGSRCQSPYR